MLTTAAHANFIDRMRSTMENDNVQVLDAKIERLVLLTEGRYGKLLDGEQARYGNELEAAHAEWERRFPTDHFAELAQADADVESLFDAEGQGRR